MLAYRVEVGDRVAKGDVIAELVDPSATDPQQARRPIVSGADGLVLSRRAHKYIAAGRNLAKVVGSEPLPERQGGYLLED